MWVVKLGGSLDGAGTLAGWVQALAGSDQALIVCPGGGGFADQVRMAQGRWSFGPATAHRMAILAMEQMAHLLCALAPSLTPIRNAAVLRATPNVCRAYVWFPASEMLEDARVPHSWDLTSDSLAAILARRIAAEGLALVKSAPLPAGRVPCGLMQRDGVLDGDFHRHGRSCGCPVWLLRGDDSRELGLWMTGRLERRVLFD